MMIDSQAGLAAYFMGLKDASFTPGKVSMQVKTHIVKHAFQRVVNKPPHLSHLKVAYNGAQGLNFREIDSVNCLSSDDNDNGAGKLLELARLQDGIIGYCFNGIMDNPIKPRPKKENAARVKDYMFNVGFSSHDNAPSYCNGLFKSQMTGFLLQLCSKVLEDITSQCPQRGGTARHSCGDFSLYACPRSQDCIKTT